MNMPHALLPVNQMHKNKKIVMKAMPVSWHTKKRTTNDWSGNDSTINPTEFKILKKKTASCKIMQNNRTKMKKETHSWTPWKASHGAD